MSRFRPQLTTITDESLREAACSYGKKSPYITISYPTYRELKKNIERHLREARELPISVYRSKRGEWGEWYELWSIVNGKPAIVEEGWS